MKRSAPNWGTPPWTVSFRPKRKSLPSQVDFAIVGAGFSGLAAAACLKRLAPEKSVIVLEAGSLGFGSSGRTGGMTLAESAAGDLPGLGDVLRGYKKILRDLHLTAELNLPGAYELARGKYSMDGKEVHPLRDSPIHWSDSGRLRAVKKVPGGTVNPGKVLAGLARVAEKSGVSIFERTNVTRFTPGDLIQLHVHHAGKKRAIHAHRILLATNAASLELTGLTQTSQAYLTFALATEPLAKSQIRALGLHSRKPFYTVDFPYLWGRLFTPNVRKSSAKKDAIIFGAGLVPNFVLLSSSGRLEPARTTAARSPNLFNIRKGQSAERLRTLERRIRNLHPVLKNVRITHRWAGPILFTPKMRPIFRHHPESSNAIILAGFNGHGVALSVYLGKWAAESLLGKRPLPRW